MPFDIGNVSLMHLDSSRFDFTLPFEHLYFSVIPSALFIVTSSCRILSQARKPKIVHAPVFRYIKLGAIVAYLGLVIGLVVVAALNSVHPSNVFMAAIALRLVATLFVIALSVIDHSRNPRPSALLTTYLCLTLLLDATSARTLFLSTTSRWERAYSSMFSATVAMKAVILVLEAQQKARWVRWGDEKEHSPEETSGIFSLGVFFWLNKLFLAGYRTILTIETLLPLDRSLDTELLHDKFSQNIDDAKLRTDRFGLAKALARTLKVPLLLPVAPRLALLGFTFCQPFFIESLLDHLQDPTPDRNAGYGLIGASFLIYTGIATSMALTWYFHHRLRIMMRSILIPEIFIRATKASVGTSDPNAALTLMSTDIERVRVGFRTLHELWACLIQVALAAWMLYIRLGVVFVAAFGLVCVCFVCLGVLINFTGDSQRAWMTGVQTRVGLTATVITTMKDLKISGLSAAVGDILQKLRVDELAAGARYRRIFIAAALLGFAPLLMGPPLVFAFTRPAPDNSRVFTSLSFLTLMTLPLSQVFQAVPELVSGFACLGRIQAFMFCETHEDTRQLLSEAEKFSNDDVVLKDASFGWKIDRFVLQNANLALARGSLNMIIGPVGSGKSTFCRALLGEMPHHKGTVAFRANHSHVGYCDQTAFLFNGSIRENITGFSVFDMERYSEIINATALHYDLSTLPHGDRTVIGSGGITLSGGQKQRVSLARALYIQADLLILDDIFSGLDAKTEEFVFKEVFGPNGLLRKRRTTVVLSTHSVRHLPAADHIIRLEEGIIVAQGSFDYIVERDCYQPTTSTFTTAMSESRPQRETMSKTPVVLVEQEAPPLPNSTFDSVRRYGDKQVYKHYIKSMGTVLAACSGFFALLWGFFTNFSTIWLTFWTGSTASTHHMHSNAYYVGVYSSLQVCAIVALLLLGTTIYISSVKKAGASIHKEILNTLIRAPLAFFTKTDAGIITNLFSQDLNLIDTELPEATINLLVTASQTLGQIVVMLLSSAYLAISYPFLGVLLFVVQRFYLRTSKQLRLLDLEAKSPLYTHFQDTVRGITTLRAAGFMSQEFQKNARLVNCSQRPAYLLLMVQEWLNLVLNIVVMIIAVLVTTFALQFHSKAGFAGASLYSLLSLAENLSGIVIYWTKLETSLGAIARLKTFSTTTTSEDLDEEDIIPSEVWPQSGVVKLEDISASYKPHLGETDCSELALRGISITIASGERVAICGRTGSGKSSMIALLLKLLEPMNECANNATIDDTPLRRINRTALRQRIIAVPQEAVFLPNGSTFRTNMDLHSSATADECEQILHAVGLWSYVAERGGLDACMDPGSMSVGQRQLMSVGRALLRRRIRARQQVLGGILLLDEVSSSVDLKTERVMQNLIRDEFQGYTVIAVSHRLDMIMDYDRVIVMERGEIMEVGNPIKLAGMMGSRFGELLRTTNEEQQD